MNDFGSQMHSSYQLDNMPQDQLIAKFAQIGSHLYPSYRPFDTSTLPAYPGTTDLGQKLALQMLYQPRPVSPHASGIGLVGGALTNLAGNILNSIMMGKMLEKENARYQYDANRKAQEDALNSMLRQSMYLKNMAQVKKYLSGAGGGGHSGGGSSSFSLPDVSAPPF